MGFIISAFVPEGMVLGTLKIKTYDKIIQRDNSKILKEFTVSDCPHAVELFSRFGFVYFGNNLINHISFLQYLDEFQQKYSQKIPEIDEIPALLFSFFSELKISITGYLAGYKFSSDGKFEQHVYLISLFDQRVQRVNISNDKTPVYYYHTCGDSQIVDRLFGSIKIKTGEDWKVIEAPQLDFMNFTVKKAKSFVKYILKSWIWRHFINDSFVNDMDLIEILAISRDKLSHNKF